MTDPAETLRTWPRFDELTTPRSYQWWYLDATSADRQHHLIMIAFVGSVFSPFYARACDRGAADPADYCAFNVGLYGPKSRHHWVFSEYLPSAVTRERDAFGLAGNRLSWDGETFSVQIDERSAPLAQPVKGVIRARPTALTNAPFALTADKQHLWWPIAPACDVELSLATPDLSWSGQGYMDTNRGYEPLHEGFDDWQWCRWHDQDVSRICYSANARGGDATELALNIDAAGNVQEEQLPNARAYRNSGWQVQRSGWPPARRVHATLDDTPFYARSLLGTDSDATLVMHESLSLARFRSSWVRRLLPFRMRFPPRRLLG